MLLWCLLCWPVILDITSQTCALSEIEEYGQNIDVLGVIGTPSSKTVAGGLEVEY